MIVFALEYEFSFFTDQVNWWDAEATCIDNGGQLASIHNDDENDDARLVIALQEEV